VLFIGFTKRMRRRKSARGGSVRHNLAVCGAPYTSTMPQIRPALEVTRNLNGDQMQRRLIAPFLLAITMTAGCASEEKRKQESEAKAMAFVATCEQSLNLKRGQPITEEQRIDLKWCVTTQWAKDKLRQGSTDPVVRMLGRYIPNCEALLGKDWGEVGSEKRNKLFTCIEMQADHDLEWDNRIRRIIQGVQTWPNKQAPINCYTYGNWTQCR
jgi:hypothetical protein